MGAMTTQQTKRPTFTQAELDYMHDHVPAEEKKHQQSPLDRKQEHRKHTWITIVFLVVVSMIIGITATTCSGGGGATQYSATVVGHTVMNPATVMVAVSVSNDGKATGTPELTVQVRDAGYSYTGIEIAQLSHPLKPGETALVSVPVTVTDQGAAYVTNFKVTTGLSGS